eukprot:scaffold662_cov364-Pavlova_lutheri.AAC.57
MESDGAGISAHFQRIKQVRDDMFVVSVTSRTQTPLTHKVDDNDVLGNDLGAPASTTSPNMKLPRGPRAESWREWSTTRRAASRQQVEAWQHPAAQ